MKHTKLIIEVTLIILLIFNLLPRKVDDSLINKVNELELKIDSLNNLKDSIRTVIDSTHVKIITNEKHYQERINTIITQPDSTTESFTRQYILEYAASHGYNLR